VPNESVSILPLHLWDLRAHVEAQLRRIGDAQRLWERSGGGTDKPTVRQIASCLEAILDANTTVRETCLDARMEAVNLSRPQAT
jgi:hypothetical protein